jgi:hypothetical protein
MLCNGSSSITRFPFFDYKKAFDQVSRPTLFNILHKRNMPDPLLQALIKIYEHNEIRRLENRMTQSIEINRAVCQGCPLSPALLNIHINEKLSELNPDNITRIQLRRNK